MLTKEDKKILVNALKMVDVKQMEIDHANPSIVKWFRFGSYNGLKIAVDIINEMPEIKNEHKQSK